MRSSEIESVGAGLADAERSGLKLALNRLVFGSNAETRTKAGDVLLLERNRTQ